VRFLLFFLCLPLFLLYLLLCLLSPLIRFGGIKKGRGRKVWIIGDLIHSDYLFWSEDMPEFGVDKDYVKVGWGDRRIFLETRTWGELRLEDFLRAFFGMNPTVLRVEFLDAVPEGARELEMSPEQLEVVRDHVLGSFRGYPIDREPRDYQGGVFYESNLRYNCVTNCNNWVNRGLRLAGVTNKVWMPLSFWV
jgi:uncharacterized protein (TIGR02117 family)